MILRIIIFFVLIPFIITAQEIESIQESMDEYQLDHIVFEKAYESLDSSGTLEIPTDTILIHGHINYYEYWIESDDKTYYKDIKSAIALGLKNCGYQLLGIRNSRVFMIRTINNRTEYLKVEIPTKKDSILTLFKLIERNETELGLNIDYNVNNIRNPSFEGKPQPGRNNIEILEDWKNCDFNDQSSFDLHGTQTLFFDCEVKPSFGGSFVGLVNKGYGIYESVTQNLNTTILKGEQYYFQIDATTSPNLLSGFIDDEEIYNFNQPTYLEVWLGSETCFEEEMVFQIELKKSINWTNYEVTFKSSIDANYIVFIPTTVDEEDLGNVLIDNIRYFQKVESLQN